MGSITYFLTDHIVYVYFFYGLAFFTLGLVVQAESARATEFRFARALPSLAVFGFLHGMHEWYEMFLVLAAHETGFSATIPAEIIRVAVLVLSFLFLLNFGTRLLPGAERHPLDSLWQVLLLAAIWAAGVWMISWRQRPSPSELLVAADVLARYALGIPGACVAAWALLRERRDFHARGMSQYGEGLLWAALAFAIFGVVGQLFARPSILFPSNVVNSATFLRTFGLPVQLLRGVLAATITITLAQALRAFEQESRLRLDRANRNVVEAQAQALAEQERRVEEVEALNDKLAEALSELTALVEMSRILSSTMEMDRLLQDALYAVVHSMDTACCCALLLLRTSGKLESVGEYRRPNAPTPVTLPPLSETATRAFHERSAVGADLNGEMSVLTQSVLAEGRTYRTLGMPLTSGGRVSGGLAVATLREEVPFGAAELSLFQALAGQVAAAMENARLYQVIHDREVELEQMLHQMVAAQEGERKRIARELHDETGQKLTALAMGLAAVDGYMASGSLAGVADLMRNLRQVADQAMVELRNIMANLRPAQLDDLGIVPALRWYVSQYQDRHPELNVTLRGGHLSHRLPSEYETILFRIVQEALTNIARHAHASEVVISLAQSDDEVSIVVEDNGVGFDAASLPHGSRDSGWGLAGLRERVAAVAGDYNIESDSGKGTRIGVRLHLKSEEIAS